MGESIEISVCVLFYNQQKYVKETLDSLFNQDYKGFEIIIRDDNSTDDTVKVIKEYLSNVKNEDIIVKVDYGKENLGIIGSLNKTLSMVSGDYIVLQGGDDISMSNRLSKSLEIIKDHNVDLVGADGTIINEEGKILAKSFYYKTGKIDKEIVEKLDSCDLSVTNRCLGGFGLIFNKNLLNFYRGQLPNSIKYEDKLITFLALMNKGAIQYNDPLIYYRRTENNVSMPKANSNEEILESMYKLKSMENEVLEEQLNYILKGGKINKKCNRDNLINYLDKIININKFYLKGINKCNRVDESRLRILIKILRNSTIAKKSKIKYIGGFLFPYLFKVQAKKQYYARLKYFCNDNNNNNCVLN